MSNATLTGRVLLSCSSINCLRNKMSFDTTDQFGDSLAACCISEVFFFFILSLWQGDLCLRESLGLLIQGDLLTTAEVLTLLRRVATGTFHRVPERSLSWEHYSTVTEESSPTPHPSYSNPELHGFRCNRLPWCLFAPTKGYTLKTSASEALYGGHPVDKTNYLCNTPTDAAPQFL